MRIVIPGGSGQVGTLLARALHADGHEVVVLSRRPAPAPWRTDAWDARTVGPWAAHLEGADAVVNLAGRSVNCRYTPANRRAIVDSRVLATRAVGDAIARAARPPGAWLQMSTATIYAHTLGPAHDEAGEIGGAEPGVPDTWRFSIDVATRWEDAAHERAAALDRTRLVLLRTAMVMSPDRGGVFDTLLALVRRGLGGPVAGGRQYVSWIHEHDFVRAVRWTLARPDVAGAVNVASPGPLPYRDFMRALRAAAGVPIGLPATRLMLEAAAVVMRTETELVLKSRRVVPGRLLAEGFAFDWPAWPAAARELVARWQALRRAA